MAPLPHAAEAPPEADASLSPSAGIPCNCLLSSAARLLLPPRGRSPPHSADPFAVGRHIRSWGTALASSSNHFLMMADDFRTFLQRQFVISNNQITCGGPGGSLSTLKFAAILPGDSVAGLVVANGLTNFLNIYTNLLVVRLVLTWFPGAPTVIVSPLSTLCDPYLNIFRGVIPPLGGTLDLSPILAFLVLNAFTSTAAALPAELPRLSKSHQLPSFPGMSSNHTSLQEKWMRRVCNKMNKPREATN